jgi:outer membrane receptor protein involved in Fe transport
MFLSLEHPFFFFYTCKMNKIKKYLILIFGLLALNSYSQNLISGKIIDGEFNEPLPFANILIRLGSDESNIAGTTSDLDGNFAIEDIENGVYYLEVSFVGYDTKRINDIELTGKSDNAIDVTLFPSSNTLEEVVVTTTVRENTEASVLAIQKRSVTLLDGLSAQSMKKTGDSNLSGAIRRVPGVSVQGGKFVYVRGLGDRYSKTLLNGMEVPGLDPDKNTLQLDIFPTNLIDNIIISKSANASLNSDFTGGIVDVILKDFSPLPEFKLTFSGTYNPEMNLQEYVRLPDENLNFLGFDNPSYSDLPINPLQEIPTPETFLSQEVANITTNITDAFTKQLAASRANSFLDYNIGISTTTSFDLGENKLNLIAALGYRYDVDYFSDYQTGTIVKRARGLEQFQSQRGELGTINSIASGLVGVSFKTAKSKINANILAIKNGESNAIDAVYQDYIENPYTGDASILTYTDRQIISIPVSGKHNLNDNLILAWDVAPSFARVYDKDFRKTVFEKIGEVYLFNASTTTLPQRLWRDLEEDAINGKTSMAFDFKDEKLSGKIKAGLFYTYKQRFFDTSNYTIDFVGRTSLIGGEANQILASENIWNLQENFGSYIQGSFQRTNRYDSNTNTKGAFISTDLKFTSKFKTNLGLRYEGYQLFYTGEDIERNIFDNENFIDVKNLYPSLNLIYSPTENSNLRVSYSRTTARPSFKESSSAQIFDPITERYFLGNPELNPSYINNFDLRFETFGSGNEIIALSGFYKSFLDPIEIVAFSVQSPFALIARNNDNAEVYGAELEFRKKIVESGFGSINLNVNTSVIVSRQKMNESEFNLRKSSEPDREIDEYRVLQGQSPYLINAGFNYANSENGIQSALYYNVQGSTLEVVGVGFIPDVYTAPFNSLNFNFSKSFGLNNNQSVTFRIVNLLDDARESRYEYFGDNSNLFSLFKPGRDFSIGYSIKF